MCIRDSLNAGLTCSGATIVLSSLDVNLITNPTAGTTALISGPIDNNGGPLGFDGNGNITVSGVISDVNVLRTNLNFHGIASLTANNTYTGTTSILAGTLLVMGSQPQSPIDLNGGTIG